MNEMKAAPALVHCLFTAILLFFFLIYYILNCSFSLFLSLLCSLIYTSSTIPLLPINQLKRTPSLFFLSLSRTLFSIHYIMALHFKQEQQKSHLGTCNKTTQTRGSGDLHQEAAAGIINGGNDHHHHHHHRVEQTPVTLDLLQSNLDSSTVEIDDSLPVPFGWQRFLDLQTGAIYYKKAEKRSSLSSSVVMNRNRATSSPPKLDLKLNLSPPNVQLNIPENNNIGDHDSSSSPTSSCLSSELNYHVVDSSMTSSTTGGGGGINESPRSTRSSNMVLVGCPNCLMYVMLSSDQQYPKCPICKSSVLLDFFHHHHNNKTRNH